MIVEIGSMVSLVDETRGGAVAYFLTYEIACEVANSLNKLDPGRFWVDDNPFLQKQENQ